MPLPHSYPSTFPSRWTGTAPSHPAPSDAPIAPVAPIAPLAPSESPIRPMMPLGQFRDTFIVAIDDEGIAIIDQHVAHERVLFERITERLTSGTLESQRLLVPMLVDMSASGRQALV